MPERCGHKGKMFLISQGNCARRGGVHLSTAVIKQQLWWCTCWSQRISSFFKFGCGTSLCVVSLAILDQLKVRPHGYPMLKTNKFTFLSPSSSLGPCIWVKCNTTQNQQRWFICSHALLSNKGKEIALFLFNYFRGPIRILLCIIDVLLEVWR